MYLSILHSFKKDPVSCNLSSLQLHPPNLAECSNSRLEDAVFVEPAHFLVDAGREPQGAELSPCRRDLCPAALELFWRVCGELALPWACGIWAFSVSEVAQSSGNACHWGCAIFWNTVLVNALADVSHSAWSEQLSGLWCWELVWFSKALSDGQPWMLWSSDFLPIDFSNMNVSQFGVCWICDTYNFTDLWALMAPFLL